MGDPKWKECFIPVFSEAVEFLSNLLGSSSNFMAKLIQAGCITLDQMDKIVKIIEKEGEEKAAGELFRRLRKRPKPFFNTFCEVLKEVEQGGDLLELLTKESSTAEKEVQLPSIDHSGVSNVDLTASAKSEEWTPVQARAQSLAGRLDPEEEAHKGYQAPASKRVKEAGSMYPNVESNAAETDSVSDAGKERLTVQVLKKYKEVYKENNDSFRRTIKRAFSRVYKKGVKIDETFPKKLCKSSDLANFDCSVTETVAFRIVFPKLKNCQLFELQRQQIVQELSELTRIPKKQVKICASKRPCTLSVEIPGDGFICFMADLGVAGKLDFLYTVDDEVIVKIGLLEIPLKTLHGTQDPNCDDNDSQLFSKEPPVLSNEVRASGDDSPKALHCIKEEVSTSPNHDTEKRFQKDEDIVKTSQSHPETSKSACLASDKAVPEATSAISSTFNKRVLIRDKDEVFRALHPSSLHRKEEMASALEGKVDDVLGYMQVDDGFEGSLSEDKFKKIVVLGGEAALKRGADLFTKVCQSKDDRTKLQFAFALYAVCPAALDSVGLESNVHEIVCDKAMREGLSRCRPLRHRLNTVLKDLPTKRLSLLVVGKTGVGKSTLVNALFGEKVAKEDCTTESVVQSYAREVDDTVVRVWETPGLWDYNVKNTPGCLLNPAGYLVDMKTIQSIDLLLLCVDAANNNQAGREDKDTVEIISRLFSKWIWYNAVLVFTKVNLIRDSSDERAANGRHMNKQLHVLTNQYRDIFQSHGGLSKSEAESVLSVPVGSRRDKVLADGQPWLPELWVTAAEKTTQGKSKAVFIGLRADHLQAAAEGGTGDQEERGEIQLSRKQTKRIAMEIRNIERSDGISREVFRFLSYRFKFPLEYLWRGLFGLWELIIQPIVPLVVALLSGFFLVLFSFLYRGRRH